jgi:hypothetical protein
MLISLLLNIDVVPCDMVVTLHDTTIVLHVSSTYLLPLSVVVDLPFDIIVVPPILD